MGLTRRLLRATLGRRLPRTSGVETVRGLSAPVVIRRDRWHIPHIEARTPDDAWFALGVCQGQDRAFQIELYRRLAAGRLAELVGADALDVDRLMRRLGLWRIARAQLEDLTPTTRRAIEAFARGVTVGAGRAGSPRPAHEFTLLRTRPAPHEAADVIATIKLMGFLLSANWQTELIRLKVLELDGVEALRRIDPGAVPHLPVTTPPGEAIGPVLDRLAEDVDLLHSWVPVGGGSNNWVLDASRTGTGRPLLANDPHLPGRLPPFWYLAHLDTPAWSVAGAALAGTPGIAAGHNGHGAWGVTSGHCDDADLFLEEVDGHLVRDGDGWAQAEVREEVIHVRGGDDHVEEVLTTRHGPIISPPLEGHDRALSIRGMWREPGPVEGFLAAVAAEDFDSFRGAFADWPGMSLNVVWADTGGTVAWQLVGELPDRRTGFGTVPLPGWRREVGWDGRVPFAAMPHDRDPPDGVLASANNRPVTGDTDTPFLGADFLDGYRLAAILEATGERDDWTVPATMAAQLDTRSLPWRELRDPLAAVTAAPGSDAATALALLDDFDGDLDADSPAAAVFVLTVASLTRRVVAAAAPGAAEWVLGRSPAPDLLGHSLGALKTAHVLRLVREQPDGWFPGPWEEVLRTSLADAIAALREAAGPDPDDWAWGEVRPLVLRHPVSDAVPALADVFELGPMPLGGDAHTIPQASVPPAEPLGDPVAIAAMRLAIDVGDWSSSRWSLPGGQSGNPLSPHYDDLLPRWRRGEGVPIAWEDEEVTDATVATLRLLPLR